MKRKIKEIKKAKMILVKPVKMRNKRNKGKSKLKMSKQIRFLSKIL